MTTNHIGDTKGVFGGSGFGWAGAVERLLLRRIQRPRRSAPTDGFGIDGTLVLDPPGRQMSASSARSSGAATPAPAPSTCVPKFVTTRLTRRSTSSAVE